MADTLTSTAQINPAVETYYDRALLRRAMPYLVHRKWAQTKTLKKKSGNTMKFRRYSALAKATTPLTEGITPSGKRLSKTDILAQLSQYGDYVHVTDVVEYTVEDDVLNETSDILSQQYGETLDELTRDVIVSCASSTNSSSGANGETVTELNTTDIEAVVKTLLGNNARMVAPRILAGTGQGTSPVRPAFWGIINTYLIDDLEDCTGFKSTSSYPSQMGVEEAEWGLVKNVRFVTSSEGHRDTSQSPDQFKVPIIGQNAYGTVRHETGDVKSIFHDKKTAGGPLEQSSTMGWKTFDVTRILNDNFMHILVVTHSSSVDS